MARARGGNRRTTALSLSAKFFISGVSKSGAYTFWREGRARSLQWGYNLSALATHRIPRQRGQSLGFLDTFDPVRPMGRAPKPVQRVGVLFERGCNGKQPIIRRYAVLLFRHRFSRQ
jgi:hypothetical protein